LVITKYFETFLYRAKYKNMKTVYFQQFLTYISDPFFPGDHFTKMPQLPT